MYKFIVISIMICFSYLFVNRLNAEYNFYKIVQGKMYLKGVNQIQGYISKTEYKGEEYFVSGIVLIKNGYKNEGFSYMKTGFDLTGKPSLGRILAQFHQKKGDFDQAENIYKYNKNVEPYRFEARMDLLYLYQESKQSEKAKAMALEIITLPVKVPSQKITQYKNEAKHYLKGLIVKNGW